MRTLYLLLLISVLYLVNAKHLPDDRTSRALLRDNKSFEDESNETIENQSNDSKDDDDDTDDDSLERKALKETNELQRKYDKEQRKIQEKRAKEELKREKQLEKERIKKQELEAKFKEEQRKLQEKLEKHKLKREEKLAKEESKKAKKIAKDELKAEKKNQKQSELEKKRAESANKSLDSTESEEELDFDDIWKNYIYQKYGLTENSTDLDRHAAVNRYYQEEIGLNANTTMTEYRQAVLQLVQSKLGSNFTSQSSFRHYFISNVNALDIQKLQADVENKIAELENDTALLQNVNLPWTPEAKQAIGQEKSILTAISQFLSDVVPTWFTGGKPSSNNITTPLSNSDNGVTGIASSSTGSAPNSNEGSSLTSNSKPNNAQQLNVSDTDVATASSSSINSGIAVSSTSTNTAGSIDNESSLGSDLPSVNSASNPVNVVNSNEGDLHVGSNIDLPTGSTSITVTVGDNNAATASSNSINPDVAGSSTGTNAAGSIDNESSLDSGLPNANSVSNPINVVTSNEEDLHVGSNIDLPTGSIAINVTVGDTDTATGSSNSINPDVAGSSAGTNAVGSIDNESSLDSDLSNANSVSNPVNVVTSNEGDLHVGSIIDVPTDSTTINVTVGDTDAATVPNNSKNPDVTGSSTGSDAAGSIDNESSLDSDLPNANSASNSVNVVTSNEEDLHVGSNIALPTGSTSINVTIGDNVAVTVSSNSINPDVAGSSTGTNAEGLIDNESSLGSDLPNANSALNPVNFVISNEGDLQIGSNSDVPMDSTTINVTVGDSNAATASSNPINPDVVGSSTGTDAAESQNNESSLDNNLPNANSASNPVDVVTSNEGDLHVGSNIDLPSGSTNINVNENNLISELSGSQSTENGILLAVPSTTSTVDTVATDGSTTNDLLSINIPSSNNPAVDGTFDSSTGIGDEQVAISDIVETSSDLSTTLSDITSANSSTISSDAQSSGADTSSSAPPSTELLTAINDISTGTEAISGSVTSNADVNVQTPIDNTSNLNSETQIVAESTVSNTSETSINTAAMLNLTSNTVESEPSLEGSSALPNIIGSLDASTVDQSNSAPPETISVAATLPNIAENDATFSTSLFDTTTNVEQPVTSLSSGTESSVNEVSNADFSNIDVSVISQDAVITGPLTTTANTVISSDVTEPLNIATSSTLIADSIGVPDIESVAGNSSGINDPISGSSIISITDTESSIATSSDTISVDSEASALPASYGFETVINSDTISSASSVSPDVDFTVVTSDITVESTGTTTIIPDVTVLSNADTGVDIILNNSEASEIGSSDSIVVVSINPSDTTSIDPSSTVSNLSVNTTVEETVANTVSVGPESFVNTDIAEGTSVTEESANNALDVAPTTVVVISGNDNVTSGQEIVVDAPIIVAEIANIDTSNVVDTTFANVNSTAGTNNSNLVDNVPITSEDAPVSIAEVTVSTDIPVVTSADSSGTDTPVSASVVSEPSTVSISVVADELPVVPIDVTNIVPTDVTLGGDTVTLTTVNSVEPVSVNLETTASLFDIVKPSLAPIEVNSNTLSDVNVIEGGSDMTANSKGVELPSANSINDVSTVSSDATGVEALGADSSFVTTEVSQATQNTNTPTIPVEIAASLLEVTQQ